jgi:fucose permease
MADSAWNAWIGNLDNANQLLGLLHGCYGIGAVISPLVASLLIADAGLPWFYFYYIMVCLFQLGDWGGQLLMMNTYWSI